jgi:hypothetical protein
MDKCQLKLIDGDGENTRASLEGALLTALLQGDDNEFNRLEAILKQLPNPTLVTEAKNMDRKDQTVEK